MQTTCFDFFFNILCVLEVDLFLSVSWFVVFWEHLLLKKLWCLEPDAGGCWWLPGGAQCSWISFELQLVPQLLLRLLTIFQDLACVPCLADNVPLHRFFYSDLLLCSSRSSACPRRHDGSAHGGTRAALSLPTGGGKQRLPFLKQIINERLGWSSNFWAAEGVYSRKMHTHVRLKGPEKLS